MSLLESLSLILLITVTAVFLIQLYIKWTQKFAPVEHCTMEGKTVIVTGGNNGIGKATVKLLAEKNARVIIAGRNMQKAYSARDEIIAATGNTNISVKYLDLSSLSSVRSFAEEIQKEEKRVDVLINNASMIAPANRTITEDGLEVTYATNHFGPFLLTNLLLDLLKKSAPSRIINVSSVAHTMGGRIELDNLCAERRYQSFMLYNHTKLANILFTHELSRRLEGTGVTANSLHPGTVHTSLLSHRFELKIVEFLFARLFFKKPEVGAQTSLYLAVSDNLEGVSGQYFDNCHPAEPSPRAMDDGMARKLWEVSERLTGLHQ